MDGEISVDTVKTASFGRVFKVTLDRPKVNAIDATTSQRLGEAFRQLQDDPNLSVGILTGAGDSFFSVGWDLKAAESGEAPDADHGVGGFAGLTEYWDLTKPVIAAVNGLALGGGFELALAADMIVAADTVEFGMTEAAIGLVADGGGTIRLPRRLPRAIAMEMLMTGRRVAARELLKWGLINEVVPQEELSRAAHALADRVAACAPLSLQAIKEIDLATEGMSGKDAFHTMRHAPLRSYGSIYTSDDAREGCEALREKRRPVWTGR